ncbi:MAG: hypothetical protein ACRD1T_27460, partial [Acidimicrobiia bacterium]
MFFKLLIPFLTLILIVGSFGAFLIVRDLSSRAQTALDQDLLQSSLNARAILHDRELYLLESVNFAANLQGMAPSVSRNDPNGVASLLESVLALKTDLTLVVATNREGVGMVEFVREAPGGPSQRGSASTWAAHAFIDQALHDPKGEKSAGFLKLGDQSILAIAGGICSDPSECSAAGAAIVGISTDLLAREAAETSGLQTQALGLAIYDGSGQLLASSGKTPLGKSKTRLAEKRLIRRNETVRGTELSSLYAPLEFQGRREGIVAVSLGREAAFSPIRGAGTRLVLILLGAMAGIVAIGALLSKFILAQIRPLLETNRALGGGDLTARAPIV